jgi:hypothetical protein
VAADRLGEENPMTDPALVLRRQHALLTAVVQAHAEALPRRAISLISAAADELLDPLGLPEIVAPEDSAVRALDDAVEDVIATLRQALPRLDAITALACGRAVCQLVDARGTWAGT